ncbi:MAG: START domain-containing protein [SAR324 cluster bacterium]|nr:START domain-containing protein [SAR324 cluster bacterium]
MKAKAISLTHPLKQHVRTGLLVLLISLLLSGLWGQAVRAEWELKDEKDGIKVFVQKVPGSDYDEFKGVVTLKTSVASVLAMLDDTPSYTKWIDKCAEAKLIKLISFTERYIYQVSDLPWPVDDRDVVIHSVITQEAETKAIIVSTEADAKYEYPSSDGDNVRVPFSQGYYRILDIGDGQTEITWRLHTVPGGSIPTSLVNALLVEMPMNTLKNLKKEIMQKKYQTAAFEFSPEGSPIGWAVKEW